jgi:site-specific DNA-methyltransferase (adenine-specific)
MIDIRLGDSLTELSNIKDVNLIFADIPYPGMTIHDGSSKKLTSTEWHSRFGDLANLAYGSLADQGVFAVLLNTKLEPDFVFEFPNYVKQAGFTFGDVLLWHTPSPTYGPVTENSRKLRQAFDYVFIFYKGDDHLFNAYKYTTSELKELNGWYSGAMNIFKGTGISDTAYHAASEQLEMKHRGRCPQRLVEYVISLYTAPGDLIVDPFLGSGTTAAAAKKLGRSCIGIDLNPKNIELAKAYMDFVECVTK